MTKLGEFLYPHNAVGRLAVSRSDEYSGPFGAFGSSTIKNVQFESAGNDALRIKWETLSAYTSNPCYVSIYLDGEYYDSTQAEDIIIGSLTPGDHRINITLEPVHLLGQWPGLSLLSGGRQPYLSWSGAGNDVTTYYVYWDNGGGTVDYDGILSAITQIEATHLTNALPSSGSGSGLLSSEGEFTGTASYAVYEVVIDTGGQINEYGEGATFKWRVQTYEPETGVTAWSAYTTLTPIYYSGESYALSDGISVSFSDNSKTFAVNDTWTITVKCRAYYRYPVELEDGTYKFAVRARDAAGNISANTTPETAIVIDGDPPEPYGLAINYAGNSRISITGTCPNVTGLWAIVIVSNGGQFNQAGDGPAMPDKRYLHSDWQTFGLLTDAQTYSYLIGDGIGANETFEYVTGALTAGYWAFQVLAVDQAGHFSDGTTILSMELRGSPPAYTIYPESPENLDARQLAAGNVSLTFDLYGLSTDTNRAVSARIYYDNGTGTVDYSDIIATVNNPMSSTWNTVSITIGGLLSGTTYKFAVRAVSTTDAEDNNTETVSIVSDAQAPVPPNLLTVTT